MAALLLCGLQMNICVHVFKIEQRQSPLMMLPLTASILTSSLLSQDQTSGVTPAKNPPQSHASYATGSLSKHLHPPAVLTATRLFMWVRRNVLLNILASLLPHLSAPPTRPPLLMQILDSLSPSLVSPSPDPPGKGPPSTQLDSGRAAPGMFDPANSLPVAMTQMSSHLPPLPPLMPLSPNHPLSPPYLMVRASSETPWPLTLPPVLTRPLPPLRSPRSLPPKAKPSPLTLSNLSKPFQPPKRPGLKPPRGPALLLPPLKRLKSRSFSAALLPPPLQLVQPRMPSAKAKRATRF